MIPVGNHTLPGVLSSLHTARVHDLSVREGLSRVSWKLSSTVLRGGTNGNVGSLLDKLTGRSKQPMHIGMQNDSLFAFAGIWERWKDGSGTAIETCSILTTTPNSLLAEVHDRMPVILQPTNYESWLDAGFEDLDILTGMLKPFDPARMKCHSVSAVVNNPSNDGPECVAEVESLATSNLTLFLST
jgi:hypothetical protein